MGREEYGYKVRERVRRHRGALKLTSINNRPEDLHLETLPELRRHYYKKHPIIIYEIQIGKIYSTSEIAARVGCGRSTWYNFLSECLRIKDDIKKARKQRGKRRIEDGYTLHDACIGMIPVSDVSGVDAL